jgi:hypothetical protein
MPIVEIVNDIKEFIEKIDKTKPVHMDSQSAPFQRNVVNPLGNTEVRGFYNSVYRLYGIAKEKTAFAGQIIVYEKKTTDFQENQKENNERIELEIVASCKNEKIEPTLGQLINVPT